MRMRMRMIMMMMMMVMMMMLMRMRMRMRMRMGMRRMVMVMVMMMMIMMMMMLGKCWENVGTMLGWCVFCLVLNPFWDDVAIFFRVLKPSGWLIDECQGRFQRTMLTQLSMKSERFLQP